MKLKLRSNREVKVNSLGEPYRLEIQGLRALSILQVLLFHAWHVGSPIGVIVFVMLSAYLLVGSYVRSVERAVGASIKDSETSKSLSKASKEYKHLIDYSAVKIPLFTNRWARTFKRLTPLLFLTIIGTVIAFSLIYSQKQLVGLFKQAFASAFYVENWFLQTESNDYFALTQSKSAPLMHLWSMSMQGQIFLLFPLVMWLVAVIAKWSRQMHNYRKLNLVVFSVIGLSSFIWTLTLFIDPSVDIHTYYYDTRIRMWEFSIGAIVALIEPKLKFPKLVAQVLSTIAFGVIIIFYVVSIGTYPGPIGTIPLLSAAVFLLTMKTKFKPPLLGLLRSWPLVTIGDSAYALYLIHWPLFNFYMTYYQKASLGWISGLGLIILSLVVALILTRLIDTPISNNQWLKVGTLRPAVFVISIWVVSIISVYGVMKIALNVPITTIEDDPVAYPGSRVLEHPNKDVTVESEEIARPIGSELENQWVGFSEKCQGRFAAISNGHYENSDRTAPCQQYNKNITDGPYVLVVGNSHAEQFMEALTPIADERNWNLAAKLIAVCPFVSADKAKEPVCAQYHREILQDILKAKPDVVIVVSTHGEKEGKERLLPGHEEIVKKILDAGIKVVGIRDNPRFPYDAYECSSDEYNSFKKSGGKTYLSGPNAAYSKHMIGDLPSSKCYRKTTDVYDDTIPPKLQESLGENYYFIDPQPALCVNGICPGLIGNIFVYMDDTHICKAYSHTMSWVFKREFEKSNWLDGTL